MPPPGPSTDPYSTQRPPSQHPSTTWGSNPIHSTSAPCFYHPPAHVSVVCNGHHGCVDASAHALHLAEREHAVLCGLADVDAQVAGQSSLNLLGAVQPACVCATGGRSAQPRSSRRRSACVCVYNRWEVSAASIFSAPFSLRVCVQQLGGQRSLDLLDAVQPVCARYPVKFGMCENGEH